MRVRHLLYGGLLAAALFASASFANAHETGAASDFTNSSNAETSATSAVTPYKEVPQFAADWTVSAVTQKFAAVTSHPSVSLQFAVSPVAGNDGGQIVKAFDDQSGRSGSVVDQDSFVFVISARAGPAIATASVKLAPGVLSNYSGLAFGTAEVLAIDQSKPRFAGLVRTEHIVLAAAAQSATAKETIGA